MAAFFSAAAPIASSRLTPNPVVPLFVVSDLVQQDVGLVKRCASQLSYRSALAAGSATLTAIITIRASSKTTFRQRRVDRVRSVVGVASDKKDVPVGPTIGIDLGTTNSAVAVIEAGKPTMVPNRQGGRTTPSVVAFTRDQEMLVGEIALRQAAMNPLNTFGSVKRLIGRRFSEVSSEEVQGLIYQVVCSDDRIRLEASHINRDIAPEEVAAEVLRRLKFDVEAFTGQTATHAVITVPAYFDDSQRKATIEAAGIAGLRVQRLVNEPTAAALAFGMQRTSGNTDWKVLVFDLGGGTLDVTALSIGSNVYEVLATSGDMLLGGDDFDRVLVKYLIQQFQLQHGKIDLVSDRQAFQRLYEAALQAKEELSTQQSTHVSLPFIAMSSENTPLSLEVDVSRQDFEDLSEKLVKRLELPVLQALDDAKLNASDIDEVILVGGSTRMPSVKRVVEKLLGDRAKVNQGMSPDETIALGAALQAGTLRGQIEDLLLMDVIPLSLGTAVVNDGKDVPGPRPLLQGTDDREKSRIEQAIGKAETSEPDQSSGCRFCDSQQRNFCTCLMEVMVPRNAHIPSRGKKRFFTATDNCKALSLPVLQGEQGRALDNTMLGEIIVSDLPAGPAGQAVDITFTVSADGTLTAKAYMPETKKGATVTIGGASRMQPSEKSRLPEALP